MEGAVPREIEVGLPKMSFHKTAALPVLRSGEGSTGLDVPGPPLLSPTISSPLMARTRPQQALTPKAGEVALARNGPWLWPVRVAKDSPPVNCVIVKISFP